MIKYYIIQRTLWLKIHSLKSNNFIFIASHLKIYPAVHLNASRALVILVKKKKLFFLSLL